jgi:ADP-ribose pyrophosphatase YjhB (NUDIX family)
MNTANPTHFIGKVTQKAIICHDGKILLTRDVGFTEFELPGGRLDLNEDPKKGLEREIKEELGVDIHVHEPIYVCQTLWGREKSPHYFVAFHADLLSPLESVKPDGAEVEEMKWVKPSELSSLAVYQECIDAIAVFYSRIA